MIIQNIELVLIVLRYVHLIVVPHAQDTVNRLAEDHAQLEDAQGYAL